MTQELIIFWIIFLLLADAAVVGLILFFVRKLKTGLKHEVAKETSLHLLGMIEPLIKEAEAVANSFDTQLKEKKQLVNRLNEDLDTRIISLNMLLNRAKACLNVEMGKPEATGQVYKQQEAILKLHAEKMDPETIAKKLSMPKGEVELVIDLKTKFLAPKR